MDKSLFEQARPILEQIQDNGFEAYYVGGSVRDYVMGRNIHDIDITTSATPDEIESIFSHTIPVGKEHGTINVVLMMKIMKKIMVNKILIIRIIRTRCGIAEERFQDINNRCFTYDSMLYV